MQSFFEMASNILWGPFTLMIIVMLGGYLLIKSRGKYILNAPLAVIDSFTMGGEKNISPFMSLSNALAATMGTGNIVGVAAAVASGGAGALFWMQIAAFAGMMIKFAETSLAVRYSQTAAGPMGYMQNIKIIGKPMAVLFAISCGIAALGSGCITQSNSAAQALSEFSVSPIVCALLFGTVSWTASGGGIKGIMKLMSFIVPVITVGYIVMSVAVIIKFADRLPAALEEIIGNAFGIEAAYGGTVGYTVSQAIRYGFARGIFSNEAGMGSSAIAYSLIKNVDAKQQGMLAIAEVFVDTVICCSLTGLVLVLTGNCTNENGATAAIAAFGEALGGMWGNAAAAFIALFGLAAVCGWYTYGIKVMEFLLPGKYKVKLLFRTVYSVFSALGAVVSGSFVWAASDFATGVMMMINILGLLLLIDKINKIISE